MAERDCLAAETVHELMQRYTRCATHLLRQPPALAQSVAGRGLSTAGEI